MPLEDNSAIPDELLYEKLVMKGDADVARKPNLVSSLYRLARLANDVSTPASGNPKKITNYAASGILPAECPTESRERPKYPLFRHETTALSLKIRVALIPLPPIAGGCRRACPPPARWALSPGPAAPRTQARFAPRCTSLSQLRCRGRRPGL